MNNSNSIDENREIMFVIVCMCVWTIGRFNMIIVV